MKGKVSLGVLSTAKIGLDQVIGPMQQAPNLSIDAIASRDPDKARAAARQFGIAKTYGSYDELLADPAIEAVYIPLPNNLHVEWAERAAAARKYVLLEKPAGMSAAEAERLIGARERSGRLIVEAFMVRYTPQWCKTREIIASGRIGRVHAVQCHVTIATWTQPTSATGRRPAAAGSWTSAATPSSSRAWLSAPSLAAP
jgi:predicted dehydrogenase